MGMARASTRTPAATRSRTALMARTNADVVSTKAAFLWRSPSAMKTCWDIIGRNGLGAAVTLAFSITSWAMAF